MSIARRRVAAVAAVLVTAAAVAGCSPGEDARRDAVAAAETAAREGVEQLREDLAAELAARATAAEALAAVRPLLETPRQRPQTWFLLAEEVTGEDEVRLTVAIFGSGEASMLADHENVWAEACARLRGTPSDAPVVTVEAVRCPSELPEGAPPDVVSVLEP